MLNGVCETHVRLTAGEFLSYLRSLTLRLESLVSQMYILIIKANACILPSGVLYCSHGLLDLGLQNQDCRSKEVFVILGTVFLNLNKQTRHRISFLSRLMMRLFERCLSRLSQMSVVKLSRSLKKKLLSVKQSTCTLDFSYCLF